MEKSVFPLYPVWMQPGWFIKTGIHIFIQKKFVHADQLSQNSLAEYLPQ